MVEAARTDSQHRDAPNLTDLPHEGAPGPVPGRVSAPLNLAQAGILASHVQNPSSAAMTISVTATVRPALDAGRFREAVRRMFADLDGTRVVVAEVDGEWRQWVGDHEGDLVVHDVRSEPDPQLAADELVARLAATALDLDGRTPLIESHLVQVSPDESRWVMVGHHLACDGYSAVLMRQRTADWYTHLGGDGPAPEPAPSVVDAWAVAAQRADDGASARWAEALDSLPDRITFAEREGAPTATTTRTSVPVAAEDVAALVAGPLGSWVYPVLAAVAAYTARVLDQPRVVLGFVVAGRRHHAERNVVTSLARIVPLVVDVPDDATLDGLAAVVRKRVAAAGRLGPVAAEELRAAVPAAWRMGRIFGPICNILPFDTEIVMPGHELRSIVLGRGPVEDLQLAVQPDGPDGAGILFDGVANDHAYDDGQSARHVARMARLLSLAARAPGEPLRSLDPSLLDEVEVRDRIVESAGTRLVDPHGAPALVGQPGSVVGPDGAPTGDLGVLHADGRLEDLGPAGRTVVASGHAVHLERVRRAGLGVDGVAACEVTMSGRRLAVAVVPEEGADPTAVREAVQAVVRDGLPLLVGARVTVTPA